MSAGLALDAGRPYFDSEEGRTYARQLNAQLTADVLGGSDREWGGWPNLVRSRQQRYDADVDAWHAQQAQAWQQNPPVQDPTIAPRVPGVVETVTGAIRGDDPRAPGAVQAIRNRGADLVQGGADAAQEAGRQAYEQVVGPFRDFYTGLAESDPKAYASGLLSIATRGRGPAAAEGAAVRGAARLDPEFKAAMDLRRQYQGQAARTHPQEWDYQLGKQTPAMQPVRSFDVNTLRPGDTIQPLPGGRSRVSAPLVAVQGQRLPAEVSAEGGADFMRTPGGIWASQRPIISRQQKDAAKNTTGTPYAMTTTMGPTAIDYSHHAWEPLVWQMDTAPVSKTARADFDAAMRKKHPNWPGVNDPERTIQFLQGEDTAARTTFMSLIKKGEWQKKGFPEPGPVRWAMTEPDLRGAQTGAAGYGVARLDPQGKIIPDPAAPHTSYHTQLPGTYAGRLDALLPYEAIWRDWAARPDVAGLPASKASNKLYKFSRDLPVQTVDQQLVDDLSRRVEAAQRGR